MKKIIFITVYLFVTAIINAQQTYTISVKDAVDIAFKNVADLKNAHLDYQIAEARNKEVTGMAYPQLSASAQGNHYLSLPQILFPDGTEKTIYDVLSREGIKDGNGQPVNPDNAKFNVLSVSFFAPWNVNAGISLQQLLFEPQVFVGLQARKALLQSSDLQIKVTEDNVREAVYKNYYAVLIAEKQLWYVQQSIKRLEKLASDMNVMYKNGFVERLDIDKTTVTLNNTKAAENQLKNGVAIGYAILKLTMGLSQADSLFLKDSLTSQQVKEDILDENFSYEDRNEIKLLNKAKELQSFDIKRYRLSYFPTVAAVYSFQRNGQYNKSYESFTGKPWFWYNTNVVGLNISVPLFDGMQKKEKIIQSKFALQKIKNNLDNAKKSIDMERTVDRNTLKNAILNMDMQEQNMELAEKIYNTEKKKYEQGLGSSFTLLQSDSDLQQAQSNYFRSLYDAIIAKISYMKALGKL